MRFPALNSKGLSLTELIVASIVIGIISIGVAAYSTSIKNIQDTTINASKVNLQLAALMHLMRLDLTSAAGSPGDIGIRWDKTPDRLALCARMDGAMTYQDESDDLWNCWYQDSATSPIERCVEVPGNRVPDPGFAGSNFNNADCDQGSSRMAFFRLETAEVPIFFNADPLGSSADIPPYVIITLQALADPTQTYDRLTNPRATLETNMFMPAHSQN